VSVAVFLSAETFLYCFSCPRLQAWPKASLSFLSPCVDSLLFFVVFVVVMDSLPGSQLDGSLPGSQLDAASLPGSQLDDASLPAGPGSPCLPSLPSLPGLAASIAGLAGRVGYRVRRFMDRCRGDRKGRGGTGRIREEGCGSAWQTYYKAISSARAVSPGLRSQPKSVLVEGGKLIQKPLKPGQGLWVSVVSLGLVWLSFGFRLCFLGTDSGLIRPSDTRPETKGQ
jgi:hypothetical protein